MAPQGNFPLKKQKAGWNSLFSSQTTDEGTAAANSIQTLYSPSSPTESQPTDYQESDEQFPHELTMNNNNNNNINGHSSAQVTSLNNPKTNSPSKILTNSHANNNNNNNNNNNVSPRQTFNNNNNANMSMNNQNQLNNHLNTGGIPFKSSSQPTTPIKEMNAQQRNFRQLTPTSTSSSSPSQNNSNNIIDNVTESEFFKETIRRLLQSNEVEKTNREGEIVFLRGLITSKEAEKNQLTLEFKLRENEFKQTISQLQEENTKLKEETFEQFLINAKQTLGLDTSSILDAFHSKFKKPVDHSLIHNNNNNSIINNQSNNGSSGSGASSAASQLKIKELTNLLEKERNQHREQLIKKEEAIAEVMKEKQSLTSKIEELNSTCQMERRKTKVFEERSKKYEQKIENLKQIAVDLRSHLLSKQSENTSLKNELEELNNANQNNNDNNNISKNNDPMEEEVNATQEIIVHSPELPSQAFLENTLISTQPDPNSDDIRSSPSLDMNNNNEFSSSPVLIDPAGIASNN